MSQNSRMLDETFQIPIALDLLAVGIGSVQGAMFAAGFRKIDLLGVSIIGIATGFGGGILRDVLLDVPLATLSSNYYILVAIGAALIGMLLQKALVKADFLITTLDAVSIGMYGALGTTKALSVGLPIAPALFVGTIAAVGGGMLRDLLLNLPVALMHVGSLYAIAALIGNAVIAILIKFEISVGLAGTISVILTTLIRLLAVRFGWSLPEQRSLSRRIIRKQKQMEETFEALRTGTITLDMLEFEEDGTVHLKEEKPDTEES